MFTLTVFEILLFKVMLVLGPAQQDTGSKRVSFQSLLFYLELMKQWFYLNFKMSTFTMQLN